MRAVASRPRPAEQAGRRARLSDLEARGSGSGTRVTPGSGWPSSREVARTRGGGRRCGRRASRPGWRRRGRSVHRVSRIWRRGRVRCSARRRRPRRRAPSPAECSRLPPSARISTSIGVAAHDPREIERDLGDAVVSRVARPRRLVPLRPRMNGDVATLLRLAHAATSSDEGDQLPAKRSSSRRGRSGAPKSIAAWTVREAPTLRPTARVAMATIGVTTIGTQRAVPTR